MKSQDWIQKAKLTSEIWSDPSFYYSFLRNETNQIEAFQFVLRKLCSYKKSNLVVIDLGVGIAWTSILVSELEFVSKIIAVDINRELMDRSIDFYKKNNIGKPDKIQVVTGSFGDLIQIKILADVIICNASIHHSINLDVDIENITNWLTSDGVLILSNELPITFLRYIYYSIRKIFRFTILLYRKNRVLESISQGSIIYNDLGDNHIVFNLYTYLFEKSGYAKWEIEKTNLFPYVKNLSKRNIIKLVNFYAYKS
jgi:SAM-dependent methyltransferase